MSERYQFECPNCSASNGVELRQAGQSIRCRGCQAAIEVPTLRGLKRSRAAAPEVAGTSPRRRKITIGGRALFIVGLLVVLIGLTTGTTLWVTAAQLRTEPPHAEIDEWNRAYSQWIDRQTAAEFWKTWLDEVISLPPGQWRESEVAANRQAARQRRRVGTWFLGAIPVGLAAMVAATFLRR
jgi:hypothetical protein